MGGLEAVEVKLQDVLLENDVFRLDSEYFSKVYIAYNSLIDKMENNKIGDFATVTDGIHTSIDFDEDSEINLISAMSPKENFFDLTGNKTISQKRQSENSRTSLRIDDVIISTVGTIGNCAVVDETILPANSDRHVGIVRISRDYLPRFVSTFMLTKYGRFQSMRYSTGNVQLNLFIYKIKQIRIPFISAKFQAVIEETIVYAKKLLENSKATYSLAEQLLLAELGLTNFTPNVEPITVKSFSESFATSGRLDAEYYQPKYEEIERAFDKFKRVSLSEIVNYPVSSGITPKAGGDDYSDVENGVPFVRAVDIIGGEVSLKSCNYIKPEIHNGILKRTQLKADDVLLSIAGTVGRCGIFNNNSNANINQAVAVLRLDETLVKRLYLVVFFNSYIGNLFVSKYARHGVQTNLNLAEVGLLSIPIIDKERQQEISEMVQKSFILRRQSRELLEMAKRAVEIAIEVGEDAAVAWLTKGRNIND